MRQTLPLALILCGVVGAQTPPPRVGQQPASTSAQQDPAGLGTQINQLRANYILRPGDQILIRASEMDDISARPYGVNGDGFIDLPQLGKVTAGGVSVEKLESNLVELLKKYVKAPQVSITVVQFSSEPVFFVGAFRTPGIFGLSGGRTLVEMMSSVGGLLPNASRRIKVTRRKEYGVIPLPNAITSPDGSVSSVEINMASLRDSINPADDILLQPFDVISVERAEMIYVAGEVGKVGAFELVERDSMSVIQVLTLAGGLAPTADTKNVRILRPISDTDRRAEIPLNIERILKGQDTDKPMLPNDVLFVPKSHKIAGRDLLVVLPVVSSIVSIVVFLTR